MEGGDEEEKGRWIFGESAEKRGRDKREALIRLPVALLSIISTPIPLFMCVFWCFAGFMYLVLLGMFFKRVFICQLGIFLSLSLDLLCVGKEERRNEREKKKKRNQREWEGCMRKEEMERGGRATLTARSCFSTRSAPLLLGHQIRGITGLC